MQGLKNYLPLPFGKAAASIVSSKATINMMKITPFPTNKLPNGTPDEFRVFPAVCAVGINIPTDTFCLIDCRVQGKEQYNSNYDVDCFIDYSSNIHSCFLPFRCYFLIMTCLMINIIIAAIMIINMTPVPENKPDKGTEVAVAHCVKSLPVTFDIEHELLLVEL